MRSISLSLISIAILGLTLGACTDTEDSVWSAARSDSQLTTFVAAVQFASVDNDLVTLLDNKSASLTVFTPTNAAFDSLARELTGNPDAVGPDLLTASNSQLLRTVLQYHVLDTLVLAKDIPFGRPITMIDGGIIKIDAGTPPVITDGRNRTADIVATDTRTRNGLLHKIDRVLLPANMTIGQTVQSLATSGQFTILAQAVAAANLVGALDGSTMLTVFAPTDAAFKALLGELGMSLPEVLANPQLLASVLTYHVVAGDLFAAELPIGTPITTLEGGAFTIDGNFVVTDARGRTSRIVQTDTLASNGVIHVVDRVLLPSP